MRLIVRRLIVHILLRYRSMREKRPCLVELGSKVRRAREAKGLSQEQLAWLVAMDRTYIGGIERGERNVSALNLARIAVALDTEVGEFFPRVGTLRQLLDESTPAPRTPPDPS
jgi:transcriptional regulator with XRE-family HTH domain